MLQSVGGWETPSNGCFCLFREIRLMVVLSKHSFLTSTVRAEAFWYLIHLFTAYSNAPASCHGDKGNLAKYEELVATLEANCAARAKLLHDANHHLICSNLMIWSALSFFIILSLLLEVLKGRALYKGIGAFNKNLWKDVETSWGDSATNRQ